MKFGVPFQAMTLAQIYALATPPDGSATEAIWHQLYDHQVYVQGTTQKLTFFNSSNANGDPTLSNQQVQGTLPAPETLQIFPVTMDILSILPVTIAQAAGAMTLVGVLNDLALLILGYNTRPTWELKISQKQYGPYSLTTLGGTGGPTGWGWGSSIATSSGSVQYGRNDPSGGWDYCGRVVIPSLVSFSMTMNWAATQALSENKLIRASLFGVLNRAVR